MDPTSGIQILTYSGRPICSPKFPGLPYSSEYNIEKSLCPLLRTYMAADLLRHVAAPPLTCQPLPRLPAACVQVFGQNS